MQQLKFPLLAAAGLVLAVPAAHAQGVSPAGAKALYNGASRTICRDTTGSADAAWTCTLQASPRQVTLAYDGAALTLGVLLQACENQATLNGRFPGKFRFAPGQDTPLCNVPTGPYLAQVNGVYANRGGIKRRQ